MKIFWLFVIKPLSILLFNIYAITEIKKSTLTKKWLKYQGIVVFNVPTLRIQQSMVFLMNSKFSIFLWN